jgi:hypothetical protein
MTLFPRSFRGTMLEPDYYLLQQQALYCFTTVVIDKI